MTMNLIVFDLDLARSFIEEKTCRFCNNESLKERGESPDHEPQTCAMNFAMLHIIFMKGSHDVTDDTIRFEALNKINHLNELLLEAGIKPLGTTTTNPPDSEVDFPLPEIPEKPERVDITSDRDVPLG